MPDDRTEILCSRCRSFLCEADEQGNLLVGGMVIEQGVYVKCRRTGCGQRQRIAIGKSRNREILLTLAGSTG